MYYFDIATASVLTQFQNTMRTMAFAGDRVFVIVFVLCLHFSTVKTGGVPRKYIESRDMRKPAIRFMNRSDRNRPVQSQKDG